MRGSLQKPPQKPRPPPPAVEGRPPMPSGEPPRSEVSFPPPSLPPQSTPTPPANLPPPVFGGHSLPKLNETAPASLPPPIFKKPNQPLPGLVKEKPFPHEVTIMNSIPPPIEPHPMNVRQPEKHETTSSASTPQLNNAASEQQDNKDKAKKRYSGVISENIYPPAVPAPLVLQPDEEEELIELPEVLPVYMHDLIPNEDTIISLPEVLNNLYIPGNALSNSNNLNNVNFNPNLNPNPNLNNNSSSNNNVNSNNNKNNNINLDFDPLDRRSDPDLLPVGKPNPVISVKSKLHVNFIQQSVNDPYSLLTTSKTADGDDESKLPAGKQEEEKREARRNRLGRCYPIVEDDQFPNPARHEYLDKYPPLTTKSLQGCSFIEYASKYFQAPQRPQTKLSQKKSLQLSSLIMHSKTLYLPLHTFEAKEHQKIAMDLWKKIKYFMLDKNKIDKQSNLDPMIVAQQILDTALANPAVHDEVYAQVVKQLCNNPSKQSEMRGWELLSFVICTFPPAKGELRESLSNWLLDQTTRVADAAWYCSHCLQRTLSRGSVIRKNGPSLIELQYLKDRAPLICRISCCDGTQKAITIDSSVTIEKVFHSFCDRIQLEYSVRDLFKMFIILGKKERQLRLEAGLVVDCLRSVELFYSFNANKLDLSNAKLFIKQRIFLRRSQTLNSKFLSKLSFHQAKADILSGAIPCIQEKDIINLTAILLQHDLGDFNDKEVPKLNQFLPYKITLQKNEAFWWEKIKNIYYSMMATPPEVCIKKYLSIAQKLPLYGTTFYDIDLVIPDNPEGRKLAVNEEGIWVFPEDLMKPICHYNYTNILGWTSKMEGDVPRLEFQTTSQPLILHAKLYSEVVKELKSYIAAILARSYTVVALEDYQPDVRDPANFDLLPFKSGEVINVLVPNDGNGWEYGRSASGITGNFPTDLVKRVWVKEDVRSSC